jgi:hypothetical protein
MIVIFAALLFGFLAGLLSFKVKTRWCSNCGAVKGCPRCAGWASSGRSRVGRLGAFLGRRA